MIACLFVAMGLYVMLDQKTIDRIHHILGTKPYDLPDK
jgi:cadmium resistance protein CadD (predicted permease)